ncbi:hypothetical protein GALMADRAFT_256035 [Galerina marginata CBS 339.88]|uniref:Uncharacterized protein n=1 Tax=Galerina marginata (strain CBS 339.88) TaxID=685588 RepID=A0A067SE55_GALM3|nr:hypothetical protein GALMADRAFT_256035 [Galerina marginata CBS 339.88]
MASKVSQDTMFATTVTCSVAVIAIFCTRFSGRSAVEHDGSWERYRLSILCACRYRRLSIMYNLETGIPTFPVSWPPIVIVSPSFSEKTLRLDTMVSYVATVVSHTPSEPAIPI